MISSADTLLCELIIIIEHIVLSLQKIHIKINQNFQYLSKIDVSVKIWFILRFIFVFVLFLTENA